MKVFNSDSLPSPNGHYSHAVIHNGLVYVSGILPIKLVQRTPEVVSSRPEVVSTRIEEQAKHCLLTMQTILVESGSNLDHIVKTNIYISDIDLWSKVNEIYSQFLGSHKPARAIIPTNKLHFGADIEIDCIAALVE